MFRDQKIYGLGILWNKFHAFALPFNLVSGLLLTKHGIIEGIEKYNIADSSISLCRFLTVGKEYINSGDEGKAFANKYEYIKAFYHYEYNYYLGAQKENAILSFTYEESVYQNVVDDIKSQPGFSKEIEFNYRSFSFYLNDANRKLNPDSDENDGLTKYNFECDRPYIEWINLIGFSQEHHTYVSLGVYCFYYDIFYPLTKSSNYSFIDWDTFFTEFFAYYDWK